MATAKDQRPVEALGPDGPDPSLGICVRRSRQLQLMETVRPEPSG